MPLFDDLVYQLVHKALDENKALVIALSALITFLALRLIHRCFLTDAGLPEEPTELCPKVSPTPDNPEEAPAAISNDGKNPDDRELIEAFEKNRPPKDPIHGFIDGERDKVPFMCPFFEAFKLAQKRAEKEQEEEEFIAKARKKEQGNQKKTPLPPIDWRRAFAPSNGGEKSPAVEEVPTSASSVETESTERDPAQLRNVLDSVPFSHLPGCLKRQEQGKLFAGLSDSEKTREREAVSDQLREIYAMLAQQKGSMGDTSMDDVVSQLQLYGQ